MGSMYQKGDLQKSNTAKKRFTIRLKQEKKIGKNVSETLQNRLAAVRSDPGKRGHRIRASIMGVALCPTGFMWLKLDLMSCCHYLEIFNNF